MARLIDADALIKEAMKSPNYFIIKYKVQNAPTVDAVPVVMCKDCRHWCGTQNSTGACLRLSSMYGAVWLGTDSTDYCSFAERRDDELQEDDGRCEVPCAE